MRQTRGRAGKRCWESGRPRDSRERRGQHKWRRLLHRELRRDESQEAGQERFQSSGALARIIAAGGKEVTAARQEIPGRCAGGKIDIWAASALPFFAALFPVAYRRATRT